MNHRSVGFELSASAGKSRAVRSFGTRKKCILTSAAVSPVRGTQWSQPFF